MYTSGITGGFANSGFQFNGTSQGLRPRQAASAFAADIMRRAEGAAMPSRQQGLDVETDAPSGAQPPAGQEQRLALQDALADIISYMDNNFGDKAATAAMGLVYKNVGDGPVTEDSLGKGLLAVVGFVDTHFGTGAGDALIGRLNQNLNTEMNTYFDNGSNESFLVATTVNGTTSYSGGLAVSMPPSAPQQDSGGDSIMDMLESAAKNLRASLQRPKKRPGDAGYAGPYQAAQGMAPQSGVMADMMV